MSRYIDADNVAKQKKPLEWSNSYEQGKVEGWNNAIDYISNFAPTITLGLTDMEILMCDGDYKEALKMLIEKIGNAPTADVRPNVKGEWILHQDSRSWECSVCGEYQVVWSNFCMHCGADMQGGKNERE